jgi:hypothetical protein
VGYGFLWANVFTATAEDYAFVWVNYDGFLFVIGVFCFEGGHVAKVYAFFTGGAFIVVYFWVPGNFVSR